MAFLDILLSSIASSEEHTESGTFEKILYEKRDVWFKIRHGQGN